MAIPDESLETATRIVSRARAKCEKRFRHVLPRTHTRAPMVITVNNGRGGAEDYDVGAFGAEVSPPGSSAYPPEPYCNNIIMIGEPSRRLTVSTADKRGVDTKRVFKEEHWF